MENDHGGQDIMERLPTKSEGDNIVLLYKALRIIYIEIYQSDFIVASVMKAIWELPFYKVKDIYNAKAKRTRV